MTSQENDNPGVKIPPPIVVIFWLVLGHFLNQFLGLSFPVSRNILWAIGGLFLIISIALSIVSIISFRAHNTSILPHRPSTFLMTNGIFHYSRNPIYLAFCLIYFSMALLLNAPGVLLFLPLVFLWLRYSVIAKEEAYLTLRFGTEYTDYTQHTRRWF